MNKLRRTSIVLAAGASLVLAAATPLISGSASASPPDPTTSKIPQIHIFPGVHTVRGMVSAKPPTLKQCRQQAHFSCYGPHQLRNAYHLPQLYSTGITGKGQTIAIVDAFGSPTIRHDLAVFDKQYNLAAPPSLKVIQPVGKVHGTHPGWAYETTLDVDYAHAIAPGANILLVETPTAETEGRHGFPQIVAAEKYVISHHMAGVITQSFGATEQTFATAKALTSLRGAYKMARRAGVTVMSSSGDAGAADTHFQGKKYFKHPVTSWPTSDPLVTSVGGTQMHLRNNGTRTQPDTVWNDTFDKAFNPAGPEPLAGGSGRSTIFGRPSWQDRYKKITGAHRAVPDVSMNGACSSIVKLYLSFHGVDKGWHLVCGTSESSPLFSGIVALAGQKAGYPVGYINPALYSMAAHHAPGVVDVTKGNTTVKFEQGGKLHTVKGGYAHKGYDLASGIGTVNARWFVPQLAKYAG